MSEGRFAELLALFGGRQGCFDIIDESRSDVGDMDASVAFGNMTDEELVEETEAITRDK